MKNKGSIWCYISGVVAYAVGVLYCLSMIFIPIAIYCFIYGSLYFKVAKLSDSEFSFVKQALFVPTVVICIFAFPIGLIALVPYFLAGSNDVKVSSVETESDSTIETYPEQKETVVASVDEITEIKEQEQDDIQLSDEDFQKLEKLTNFKNQGLLTEEEFNQAKSQIMNKYKN